MKSFLCAMVLCLGCTDAGWDNSVGKLSEHFTIECYSGGVKIFEETSTGAVKSLEGGGYAWRSPTGRYYETFADCFIWYTK